MNKQKTVLVIEDDESLMLGLDENLKVAGYRVLSATSGAEGVKLATERAPDLLVLDVMLPDMSGYDICRMLRNKRLTFPIIMLTARKEETDKLAGFDAGADDYVTKPFSIKELLARVKVVLARAEKPSVGTKQYRFGDCVLDTASRTLVHKGKEVPLTRTEFDLLACLVANEGVSLSREILMREVWGMEYYGTQRSLDTFVAMLRTKIEKDTHKPKHILTVHGVGYKFSK
jgi:two-component system alkaline phosphatase synthesis response regulator PhoP/two-component system response regulator VicR